MNVEITHRMVVAACKAADLEPPLYFEDTGEMMRRAEWRVNRPRLARLLQDAVNDGPGMASRNEDAIYALRVIWREHVIVRCKDCSDEIPSHHTPFEGRCDYCIVRAEEALERLQDRQIARFEQW